MKKNFGKKTISVIMACAMLSAMSMSAFADEAVTDNVPVSVSNSGESVQPTAISGSGSITVDGSGAFTIYSPGWSLFGHADIEVSGASASNEVRVIIEYPGGTIVGNTYQEYTKDGKYTVGLTSAKAGYYRVEVNTTNGPATVKVTLGDLWK